MANIFTTVRYILEKCGSMTTWKLQKLCYYSQAWSLAWTGRSLFPEDFEAWSNGPVCPELFRKHKGLFVVSADDFPEQLESEPSLNDEQKDTIDRVLVYYGNFEPYELREESHSELPWQEARGNLPLGVPCSTIIKKEAMGEYYGGR